MGNFGLRQWMFGLMMDCPMGKALEDCPIDQYREMPATKKINFTFDMPKDELKELLLHHRKCLAKRESVIIKKHLSKAESK